MSCAAPRGLRCRNPYEQEDRMSETGTRTRITEVGRVIVPVSDQDRAIDFYVGQLGFEKRADTPYGDGARWIELAPPGGSTAIAVVHPREGDPVGRETGIALTSDDIADGRSRAPHVLASRPGRQLAPGRLARRLSGAAPCTGAPSGERISRRW